MGTRRSSNPQAQVLRPGPVRCQPPGGALSKRGAAWRRSRGVRTARRYSSRAHYTRASCARLRVTATGRSGHGPPTVTETPPKARRARARRPEIGAWYDRSSPSTTFSPRPVSFSSRARCSCILVHSFSLGNSPQRSLIKQIFMSGVALAAGRQVAERDMNSELGDWKGPSFATSCPLHGPVELTTDLPPVWSTRRGP